MFNVTAAAADKIVSLLASEEDAGSLSLRVAVRPGGCSGFSYEMFFDAAEDADDYVQSVTGSVGGSVTVRIDRSSAVLLDGATLDFRDGLQQSGFSIDNPNAQRTCGCGQSFS